MTAITVALLRVFIPVEAWINRSNQSVRSALEPLGEGTYRDATGQRYAVERLELDSST